MEQRFSGDQDENDNHSDQIDENNDLSEVSITVEEEEVDSKDPPSDPKQFFTSIGTLVALLGVAMDMAMKVIADISAANLQGVLINGLVLGLIHIPTLSVLFYVLCKDKVKMAIKGAVYVSKMFVKKKKSQAQSGVMSLAKTADPRQLVTKLQNTRVESQKPEVIERETRENAAEERIEIKPHKEKYDDKDVVSLSNETPSETFKGSGSLTSVEKNMSLSKSYTDRSDENEQMSILEQPEKHYNRGENYPRYYDTVSQVSSESYQSFMETPRIETKHNYHGEGSIARSLSSNNYYHEHTSKAGRVQKSSRETESDSLRSNTIKHDSQNHEHINQFRNNRTNGIGSSTETIKKESKREKSEIKRNKHRSEFESSLPLRTRINGESQTRSNYDRERKKSSGLYNTGFRDDDELPEYSYKSSEKQSLERGTSKNKEKDTRSSRSESRGKDTTRKGDRRDNSVPASIKTRDKRENKIKYRDDRESMSSSGIENHRTHPEYYDILSPKKSGRYRHHDSEDHNTESPTSRQTNDSNSRRRHTSKSRTPEALSESNRNILELESDEEKILMMIRNITKSKMNLSSNSELSSPPSAQHKYRERNTDGRLIVNYRDSPVSDNSFVFNKKSNGSHVEGNTVVQVEERGRKHGRRKT